MNEYNEIDASIKKHLQAIIASPYFAPQVRDYFYQVARVATMHLERAQSANPIPSFPTMDMIKNQQKYAVRLGEQMMISEFATKELVNYAFNECTETGTIEAGKVAEKVSTFVLG